MLELVKRLEKKRVSLDEANNIILTALDSTEDEGLYDILLDAIALNSPIMRELGYYTPETFIKQIKEYFKNP